MDHIFSYVAAREFPVQAPVDKPLGIERSRSAPIQKGVPFHISRRAISRDRTHPLPLATRSISAHPGLDVGDLTDESLFDPLFGINELARTLVLQTDGDHAVRLLRRIAASLSLIDRPGHRLLGVKIFACSYSVEEVPSMAMKRRSDKHCIDVFRIQKLPMIGVDFRCRGQLFCLFVPSRVNVSGRHEFNVRHTQGLPH
jgi:hypothetical protein